MRVHYVPILRILSFLIIEFQKIDCLVINPLRVISRSRSLSICDHPLSLKSTPTSTRVTTDTIDLPRLVIIIPAYNEEYRIRPTLECYQNFLLNSSNDISSIFREFEIVIIDDGSTDATCEVIQSFSAKIKIHYVQIEKNKGKGAALARGIQYLVEGTSCSCDDDNTSTLILTQDADGSGNLIYLNDMLNKLRNLLLIPCDDYDEDSYNSDNSMCIVDWSMPGMVIGNRNYNIFSSRGITRWGFQTCVRVLTANNLRIQDSQCGYKLMTLNASKKLYKNLNLQGWSHDVEILYRAQMLNIPIDEMSIEWKDMDGSKIAESGIVKVSLQMLWDVIRLRWNYSIIQCWKLDSS